MSYTARCMVTKEVMWYDLCGTSFITNISDTRAVLMGTKSCTKILIFSTRFSCENLAVEDFVTLFVGKKSC